MTPKKQKWLVQHKECDRRVRVDTAVRRDTLYSIDLELFRLRSYKLQHEQLGGIIAGACVYTGEAARRYRHTATNRLVNVKSIPKYTSASNIAYDRACVAMTSNFTEWGTLCKHYERALSIFSELADTKQHLADCRQALKCKPIKCAEDLLALRVRAGKLRASMREPHDTTITAFLRLIKRLNKNRN